MTNGFLGYDTTFMLDFVVCALILLVPMLGYGIWLAKSRRHYGKHKAVQLLVGGILLVAVLAFEIDVQFLHGGWENIVNKPGRPPRLTGDALESVRHVLWIHLIFAVSTPFLWTATIALALKHYGSPPVPNAHSLWHVRLGWLSAIDLTATSLTGLWFYYAAFIA